MSQRSNSLPDDLKGHFDDLMADKFPMSRDEARQYILSQYGFHPTNAGDKALTLSHTRKVAVREGAMPPPGTSFGYGNPAYNVAVYYEYNNLFIDDFRKSHIDELIASLKDDENIPPMPSQQQWHTSASSVNNLNNMKFTSGMTSIY